MIKKADHLNFSKSLNKYFYLLGLLWTIIIIFSFIFNYLKEMDDAEKAAEETAKALFEKDVIFRRWNARHKKVYVPVTKNTKPNPYLEGIKEREITTPSGQLLTIINPAYMTRQVHELGWETEKVRGHITSLKPIRPGNAADPWEKQALESFEDGQSVSVSIEKMDGEEFLRFMKPLFVEKSCLQCHKKQGYKTGDIRGGISVSVPMSSYYTIGKKHALYLFLGHFFLWGIGLGVLIIGKRSLNQSREDIDKLSMALEQTHSVMFITDRNGIIEYVNPQFSINTGYTADEAIGQKPCIIKSGFHSEDFYKQLWNTILSGKTWTGRIKNKKKNGAQYWEETSITPLKNTEGDITHFLAVKLDITKNIENEEKLKNTNVALERNNRDLQDFAYIASHDLQEPLRKIISFSSLLISKYGRELDEQGKDYLQRMEISAKRLRRLIDDLLTYSRLSTKAKPFTTVVLNEQINTVLSELNFTIKETEAKINLDKLPVIIGDRFQVRQLFGNLISNSLKFRKKEIHPEITIKNTSSKNGYHCIEVIDNGIGFDQQFVNKIFIPFQRLHRRTEYEGSGIGLAICKKIIELHDGQISAKSTPGKGSIFYIYFKKDKQAERLKYAIRS